jgi:chromosome segregation ATPase
MESIDVVIPILERIQATLTGLQRDVTTNGERLSAVETGLGKVETGLGKVETGLGKVEIRLDKVETGLSKVEIRLDKVETGLGKVEIRLDKVETGLDEVETGLDKLHDDIVVTNTTLGVMSERLGFFERSATVATVGRARLDERMDRLEARVDVIERG